MARSVLMKWPIVSAAILLVSSLVSSCKPGNDVYTTLQGSIWNTAYRITYRGSRDFSQEIIAEMNRVEKSLSPFMEDSRITRINRNISGEADSLIAKVFDASLRVSRASGGAFDPTVAPLVNLWGFGYESPASPPSRREIDSCLMLVGIGECRMEGMRLVKKSPGTQFNFSAITKGFGVDCVAAVLKNNGVNDFLVEIGGEIFASGLNPQGRPWRISVDSPLDDAMPGERSAAVFSLSGKAVATSGNYRNFRRNENGRIGHTISPVTGYPVASEIASATVVAPDCMTADAAATAIMAMPRDSAVSFIGRMGEGYSALLVIADSSGTFSVDTIGGFPAQ